MRQDFDPPPPPTVGRSHDLHQKTSVWGANVLHACTRNMQQVQGGC